MKTLQTSLETSAENQAEFNNIHGNPVPPEHEGVDANGDSFESIEKQTQRFIMLTSFDFYEWMKEIMPEQWPEQTKKVEMDRNSLFDKFLLAYPEYVSSWWFSKKRFTIWLREYAKFVNCTCGVELKNKTRIFYLIKN